MKKYLFFLTLLLAGKPLWAQPLQTLYYKNGAKYMEGRWTFTKRSLMPQISNLESDRGTDRRPYNDDERESYQPDADEQYRNNGGPQYTLDPSEFLSLLCEGPVTYWYPNGEKKIEMTYKSGVPNGPFVEYYADGGLALQKGNITNGMPNGAWTYFYKNGKPFYNGVYKAYSQQELKKFWAREESDYENRSDPEGTNKESLYVGGENKGLELSQHFFRFYGMFLPYAQKQGRFQFWNPKGGPWAELEFDSDRPVGIWKVWHEGFKGPAIVLEWEGGKIRFITDIAGKRRSRAELQAAGIAERKAREEAYRVAAGNSPNRNTMGEPGIVSPAPPPPTIFTLVEKMPMFPGDVKAWIADNLRYPPAAKAAGTEGRVVVKFTVQSDGRITNAKVEKGVQPDLDAEALRLVNSMPPWSIPTQNGKPVSVYFRVPVKFSLP